MNNLVLAYLGDAVFELYVREYLIRLGYVKVKELQKKSIEYVSAKAQAKLLDELSSKILSESEIEIVKRGRNAHSHGSKSTNIVTYKKSTGLETLIGYLYINDKHRLDDIMKEALKWNYLKKIYLMN